MKQIREYIPFILLGLNLIFSILFYFEIYSVTYDYIGDTIGYSILTDLFMFSVYMNKRYCTSTKIAVVGLFLLNVISMLCKTADLDPFVYDIYIISAIFLVLIFKKSQL